MRLRVVVRALAVSLPVLLPFFAAAPAWAQAKDKALDKKETKPADKIPPVKIPDKNLEAALRAVIFESQGELNEEKLNRVYILDAQGKSIKDLTGLEKC